MKLYTVKGQMFAGRNVCVFAILETLREEMFVFAVQRFLTYVEEEIFAGINVCEKIKKHKIRKH